MQDPTLDQIAKFGQPLDQRNAAKLADIDRRVTALESQRATIQVTNGAPTTTPREGTPVIDRTVPRLGIYVASSATRYWWVNLG